MKKVWRKLWYIIATITVTFVLGACGNTSDGDNAGSSAQTTLEDIKSRGVLRVAIFGDLKPYGYVDENGNYQGYTVDISKRLAKDLLGDENKVEFTVVNAEERVDVLNSGRVDIVMATFTKTPEREQVVDFASPYMKVAIGVAAPKSANIKSVDQLDGQTLILNKGTTAELLFTTKYPNVKLEKFESKSQEFQALKDGRGVALADDNSYLFPWVKENPDYEVAIKELGNVDTNNPAVKKGNTELLNFINEEFTKFNNEGYFEELYNTTLAPFFGEGVSMSDILLDEQIPNKQ